MTSASIGKVIPWVIENWDSLAVAIGVFVGAVSALIKALEVIVSILLTLFPSLKTADGQLKHVAGWLDALAKSGPLNSLAMNPKGPVTKALIIALFLGAFHAAPARAQAFSTGPSIPLLQIRPNDTHPAELAAGAGWQASLGLFQREVLGKQYDLLDVSALLFGTAQNGSGAFSAAAMVGTMNDIVGVGIGYDIINPAGRSYFFLLAFSVNFAVGPYSPPTGIAQGALGLPRGNTIFLGL